MTCGDCIVAHPTLRWTPRVPVGPWWRRFLSSTARGRPDRESGDGLGSGLGLLDSLHGCFPLHGLRRQLFDLVRQGWDLRLLRGPTRRPFRDVPVHHPCRHVRLIQYVKLGVTERLDVWGCRKACDRWVKPGHQYGLTALRPGPSAGGAGDVPKNVCRGDLWSRWLSGCPGGRANRTECGEVASAARMVAVSEGGGLPA